MAPNHTRKLNRNQFGIILIYLFLCHSTRCILEDRISLDWKSEDWLAPSISEFHLTFQQELLAFKNDALFEFMVNLTMISGKWMETWLAGTWAQQWCIVVFRPPGIGPVGPRWGCNLQGHRPPTSCLSWLVQGVKENPDSCSSGVFHPWLPAGLCFQIPSWASPPLTCSVPALWHLPSGQAQPLSWASRSSLVWFEQCLYLQSVCPESLWKCLLRAGPPGGASRRLWKMGEECARDQRAPGVQICSGLAVGPSGQQLPSPAPLAAWSPNLGVAAFLHGGAATTV